MEFITNLYQHNPIVAIVLGLIIIVAIVSIVRGLLKLALTLAIVAIIAVVFFGVNPQQILNTGKEVTQEATNYYKSSLKPIVDKELGSATYTEQKDGSYVVKTASLSIKGKKNEGTVTIAYKDKSTTVNASLLGENFKKFVESHTQQ